jgi:Protein of unknown function (DUF4232)
MIAPPKPPSHDELEALIREARERQLRRRLLGAAGVAIAAALGLSAYALATRAGPSGRTASPPALQAPACRSSQLSASFGTGGAAGLALGGLVLGNVAGRSCLLPVGRPTVNVIFRGRPLPTTERSWGHEEQFGKPAGLILRPGQKAFVEIGWRSSCPTPATAPERRQATLLVRFRSGLRLSVPDTPADRGVSVPGCGEAVQPPPWIAVSRLLRYG